MQAKYGTKWTSNFASDAVFKMAKIEWSKVLNNLEDKKIRFALNKCLDEYPDFPPTAGAFKQIITGKNNIQWIPPDVPMYIMLPTKPIDKKKGLEEIEKLKKLGLI